MISAAFVERSQFRRTIGVKGNTARIVAGSNRQQLCYVAVGYDDKKRIKNPLCDKQTKGALLIRNSWGVHWGYEGYGWLPYDCVLSGLAQDFWSLSSMEWVNTNQFGL